MEFPWDNVPDFHMKSDMAKMQFWISWKEKHTIEWQGLQQKRNLSDLGSLLWDTYEIAARIVKNEWRKRECES